METDPRKLFQRLFGEGDTPRRAQDESPNSTPAFSISCRRKPPTCSAPWAPADKVVLSDYLETVREIERRVEKMEARDLSKLNLPPAPAGPPANPDAHLKLMFDLIALAYQGNLTRVFSLMMAGEVSGLTYHVVGVSDAYHPISHYGADKSEAGQVHQDPDLLQHGDGEVPHQAASRCPTATAPCWITLCSCGAAT